MDIKYLETNEEKKMMNQNLWDTAKVVLREVLSETTSPQETRNISSTVNITSEGTRERRNKMQS